jgi:hypothetical protein
VNPVIQEERTGCGIACAAALAGVSYRRARAAAGSLGIHADDEALWSDTMHVRRLLTRLGRPVAARTRRFRSWTLLPDVALLAIKWHRIRGRPFWHWVVFVRKKGGCYVLDSKRTLKNHIRTDFGRMKPKWFLVVKPKK